MSTSDPASALTSFGFTGLESEIYAFLLTESPSTGYRISQAIGKPVANTYKAIQTLQAKGAIYIEESGTRMCAPVDSEELLERLGKEFEKRRSEAKESLAGLGKSQTDERIYHLRSRTLIVQRIREMLETSAEIALLVAPESLVKEVAEALSDAGTRGVEVIVKSDAEMNLPRVETYVATREDDLLKSRSLVRAVVDGVQVLVGHVGSDAATEAIWTRNSTLALSLHEGIAAEITVLAVAERIDDGAGPKRLAKALTHVRGGGKTQGAGRLPA